MPVKGKKLRDHLPTNKENLCLKFCQGPAPVDPGNSKGGRRWRGKTCLLIDIRLLRNNSVVGKLRGERGLNNLDYMEGQ